MITSCPVAAVMLTDAKFSVPGPLFFMTISIMPLSVAELTVIMLPSSVMLMALLAPPKIVFHTPVREMTPATTSAINSTVARMVARPPLFRSINPWVEVRFRDVCRQPPKIEGTAA